MKADVCAYFGTASKQLQHNHTTTPTGRHTPFRGPRNTFQLTSANEYGCPSFVIFVSRLAHFSRIIRLRGLSLPNTQQKMNRVLVKQIAQFTAITIGRCWIERAVDLCDYRFSLVFVGDWDYDKIVTVLTLDVCYILWRFDFVSSLHAHIFNARPFPGCEPDVSIVWYSAHYTWTILRQMLFFFLKKYRIYYY